MIRVKQKFLIIAWILSPEFPYEESHMIAIQKDASFALVVEKGAEVHSTYYVPTSFELLFKTFLYLLSSVFKIGDLVLNHLNVDVFSYQ